MRRMLINDILDDGTSKYYKYAISDLSQAENFSSLVKNWEGNLNQEEYIDYLKKNHPKKYSFWDQWENK